jgi:hypothetical protein
MTPYFAHMMAERFSGMQYNQGLIPSPVTMTPAHTGIYRPPAGDIGMMQAVQPLEALPPGTGISPTLPVRPPPMFMMPHDRAHLESDIISIRNFSYAAQAPSVGARALTTLAATAVGYRVGGALGAGAAALMAEATGISQSVGHAPNFFMRPAIERREMGAAMQEASRSWVVSGADRHARGYGLSQEAGVRLADEFQQMSADSGFQQDTGNRFTAHDLTQITGRAGRAGLLDMDQSVDQIKQRVRETTGTISKLMEILEDPDISSVIRQMSNMRQMGMTQPDMVQAAHNMRISARRAGTSLQGIQEMGGLPGAMMYNQLGLSAASGFEYGNYAAATVRQWVASGSLSPADIAKRGGVHGMTQREIQAQASFAAMPIYGASNAQYVGGKWQLDPRGVGSTEGGAAGMVQGAIGAAMQGVREAGIGSLGTFSSYHKSVADAAMRRMTPEQSMAQRFGNAFETMEWLGLSGMEGFHTVANMLHGDEVGKQMREMVGDRRFWASQRKQLRDRREEVAALQSDQRKSQETFMERLGLSDVFDGSLRGVMERGSDALNFSGKDFASPFRTIGETVSDWFVDGGTSRLRLDRNRIVRDEKDRAAILGMSDRDWLRTEASFEEDIPEHLLGTGSIFTGKSGRLARASNSEDPSMAATMRYLGYGINAALVVGTGGKALAAQGAISTAGVIGGGAFNLSMNPGRHGMEFAAGIGTALGMSREDQYHMVMREGIVSNTVLGQVRNAGDMEWQDAFKNLTQLTDSTTAARISQSAGKVFKDVGVTKEGVYEAVRQVAATAGINYDQMSGEDKRRFQESVMHMAQRDRGVQRDMVKLEKGLDTQVGDARQVSADVSAATAEFRQGVAAYNLFGPDEGYSRTNMFGGDFRLGKETRRDARIHDLFF